MAEITLDREVLIYISNIDEVLLFPDNNLYPDDDLFPGFGTLIIESSESNSGIVEGSLNIEELIVDSNLIFGQCISNKFECVLYSIPYDIAGKDILVVALENGTQVPLFKGKIDSSVADITSYERNLVAYDEFYFKRDKNVAEWWNEYWTGKTSSSLKEIRNSLLNYIDIPFYEKELVNDDTVIKSTSTYSVLSFGDCLKMICELQGCFPNIDRTGTLDFVVLGENEINVSERYEKNNAQFQDYKTTKITGIMVYSDATEITHTVGSTENMYAITSNIFLEEMSESEVNTCVGNLLNAIKDIEYIPCDIPMILSDLEVEIGSKIVVDDKVTYALKNAYTGPVIVNQNLIANASSEKQTSTPDVVSSDKSIGRKISKVEHDLYGFRVEVGDEINKTNSRLDVVDGQISAKVSREELSSEISILENQISSKVSQGELSSSVQQSATEIISTVSGAFDTWDTKDYDIKYYGVGEPSINTYFEDMLIIGDLYLDQEAGVIFELVGFNGLNAQWRDIDFLEKITEQLSTRISQKADRIDILGLVSFTDLKGEGTTEINGNNITTGLISAERIDVDNLFSQSIHLTGPLNVYTSESEEYATSVSKIYTSGPRLYLQHFAPWQAVGSMNRGYNYSHINMYTNDDDYACCEITAPCGDISIVSGKASDGGGTGGNISIIANYNSLYENGGILTLIGRRGVSIDGGEGGISLGGITSPVEINVSSSNGVLASFSNGESVSLHGTVGKPNHGLYSNSQKKWIAYMNTSGTTITTTSDKRAKIDKGILSAEEAVDILTNINIVKFVMKDDVNENNLEQSGIYAQEFRDFLLDNDYLNRGYIILQFKGDEAETSYDISQPETDNFEYTVDYTKFIPLLIKGWQEQKKEIDALKDRVNELTNLVEKLLNIGG